jgi:hypothetical protein
MILSFQSFAIVAPYASVRRPLKLRPFHRMW